MVPTQSMKYQLEAMGFKHLKVVARGVDAQLFNPTQRSMAQRETWQVGPETIVLLSVGRLAAEKNLDLVVQTYHALKAAGRDVRMVFAGDGPMRTAIQAKCPDALFVGMCTQQQLSVLYASADLLLFTSLTETFGNVTLESLACGTPVLAFDCAAAGEFITHTQNGWLAHCDDSHDYIQCALEITKDTSKLGEARAHAHASVAELSWDEIAGQVEALFQRTIALS
jgi:glycosyltransferase involved in cell wall biosynthesis